jgi:hypothetical protein
VISPVPSSLFSFFYKMLLVRRVIIDHLWF